MGIFTAGGYFQDFKNSAKRLSERVDKVESRQANIMEKLDTMQQKFNENAIQFTEIRGRIVGIEQNLSFQTRSLDKIESAVSKIADRDRGR